MFADFTINRFVHTRALEGDGEKPSRHANEGPLLILPLSFSFMMDVSQRAGSPKSRNPKDPRTF